MLRPLCDEPVGDGLFGGEPEGGGVASLGQSLHLQGGGDLKEAAPAGVFQLCLVHEQLEETGHS